MYRNKDEVGLYADINEDEELWDRISYNRLKELINKYDVISFSQDYNDYGRFSFLTIKDKSTYKMADGSDSGCYKTITAYGHGLHELREVYLNDKWDFYTNHISKKEVKIRNKEGVLAQLDKDHKRFKKAELKLNLTERSKSAKLFSFIADLSDEDFALSNIRC